MSAVLVGVLPVFALIALGYFLRTSRFLPDAAWPPIELLAFYVFYPGFLVPQIWAAQFSGLSSGALGLSAVISVSIIAAGTLLLRPFLRLSGPAFTSVFQGVVRWNSFVFLPVVVAVFGETGLATAAVAIGALVPVINVMSVLVLARWGEGQGGGWRMAVRALTRNPIILSCAAGLTLNLLRVPTFGVDKALALLGDGALPLGLIIAGAGLRFRAAAARPVTIAAVSAVKLLLLPILMWGLCRAFGGDALAQGVALACGSAPGAAASYGLARQMGGDAPLMAGIVAFTTLFSVITIPLLLIAFGVS